MSLLNQIEDNVITDLRLNDTEDEIIDHVRILLDALKKNTSIESIHFQGEFLGCIRGDKRNELVELIGGLPNLQEVQMNSSLLMVKVLTTVISKAKQLRVLKRNGIVFQGVDEDMSSCELALMTHPCLKEFDLHDCSTAAVSNDVSLDKLEKAGKKLSTVTASAGGSPQSINQVGAVVA
jgi:hypothetical protein